MVKRAIAVFDNGSYIEFIQGSESSSVTVKGVVKGLSSGLHGFHIHEFADLTKPGCMGCGGHFNPFNKPHGGLRDKESHAGDLGNVKNGSVSFRTDKISLYPGRKSIIGRALIIHEGTDDLGHSGDPTGKAGKRIFCSVIGIKS